MRTSRKKLALVAGTLAAVAFAGAAFAYFTNDGSGDGQASVGTSSEIQLDGDAVGALVPGGPDAAATVTIHNPSEGYQFVGTVSGVVEDNAGCLGEWFEVDSQDFNAEVAPGATESVDTAVRLLDPAVPTNQDVCKDKTMTITWSSN